MAKTVDLFYESIRCIRIGGITSALVDTVKVEAYGQLMPIQHLALTSGGGTKPISVRPHDPTLVSTIAKVLEKQGFNAYVYSKDTVYVSVPPPSGEDKEKTRQHIRKLGEDAKVSIRNIRKHCRNGLEASSKDELKTLERQLQDKTDEAIDMISEIVSEKVLAI